MKRAVALALIVAIAACSSSSHDSTPVTITHVPHSYEVTYRLTIGKTKSTEVVSVRRPFDGRVVIDGVASISQFARLSLAGRGSSTGVLAMPPSPAYGDVRVDIALAPALRAKLVTKLDSASFAGRRCQQYRAGGSPGAAQISRDRGADEGVVFCVDADGLVLDERTIAHGKEVRRRTATRVRVDLDLASSLFAIDGTPIPVSAGGGTVVRVTDDSRPPADFWELPGAPNGFRHRGRYLVVPAQFESSQAGQELRRAASVFDVYERGIDVIVVDRGGTIGGTPAIGPLVDASPVDAGALGEAELALGFVTNEVRVTQTGGHYVRVAGTVPPSTLVAVARALRAVPGGTLTTVPD